jgi:hypothetical protein
MRRLVVGLVLASGAACLDFDARVEAGCDLDAPWEECDAGTGGGGMMGGGGGTTGGGGGTTGGGGGTTGGDGGTTGGGGGTLDAGSRSAWRWENPRPLGGNDLLAIWNTGGELWVAGAGPSVARYTGTTWVDESHRLPELATSVDQNMPCVLAAAVSDAGDVWLAGSRLGLVGLLSDGGTRHVTSRGWDHVAAASDHGVTVFLRNESAVELDYLLADGGGTTTRLSLPSATELRYVGLTPSATWVSYLVNSTAWVRSAQADASVQLVLGDGGSCHHVSAFARLGERLVLTCNEDAALQLTDAGRWEEVPFVTPRAPVLTHRFHELPDGGLVWWLAGMGGFVDRIDPDGQYTQLTTRYFGDTYASWLSPEGNFWFVGGGGRVASAAAGASPDDIVEHGAVPQPQLDIRDLALRGDQAFAGGHSGDVWTRDASAGTWAYGKLGYVTLNAVALHPNGERCTLNEAAELHCENQLIHSLGTVTPDGGFQPPFDRRGAGLAIADDGTFRLAIGNTMAMQLADGGWLTGPLTDNRDHVSQVLATPDGMWVASNVSTQQYSVGSGAVQHFGFGGNGLACRFPGAVFGIAALDGGVLVVGRDQVQTCFGGATNSLDVPPGEDWVSVWIDATGTWWLLGNSGRVLRRAPGAGAWSREPAPLGPTPWAFPQSTRILGNAREVFIVGAGGSILRRPLP